MLVVPLGATVVDAPAIGSLIGAGVGLTLCVLVVELGTPVAVASIFGSFTGTAVGSTLRCTVVRSGAMVVRLAAVGVAVLVPAAVALGL